jgi:hypothetical protein
VVSRRALLAAAGGALLAGCGKDRPGPPAPRPDSALLRQLAAERALEEALHGAGEERLAARARGRSRRLAEAIRARGGRLYDAPPQERRPGDPAVALERAGAALAAHVAAMPDLAGRDLRRLGADLVAESAADLAVLGDALGSPQTDAFPGTVA